MMTVALSGMIGVGKSSMTEILGEHYNALMKYEEIPPLLKHWHDPEMLKDEPVVFLIQNIFKNQRLRAWRECILQEKNYDMCIIDRSYFEDKLFAKMKYLQGEMTQLQWEIYQDDWETGYQEIQLLPKKQPDVTIYLRASWETIKERILLRGREFEVTEEGMKWNKVLHAEYDNFMLNEYKHGEVIVVDCDQYDFVNKITDREIVLTIIDKKFRELGIVKPEKSFVQRMIGQTVQVTAPWYVNEGIHTGEVVEVFTDHHGEFILNCKVKGRKNQVSLYHGQWDYSKN